MRGTPRAPKPAATRGTAHQLRGMLRGLAVATTHPQAAAALPALTLTLTLNLTLTLTLTLTHTPTQASNPKQASCSTCVARRRLRKPSAARCYSP